MSLDKQLQQNITDLLCQLIEKPSISPLDLGCQELLISRLQAIGFSIEYLKFDDVDNFWAFIEAPLEGPTLLFAGHTDVVPAGEIGDWTYPPFSPTVVGDMLYGRGAADMKGSLASMILATEHFIQSGHFKKGRLAFLITSDEEDKAINGTQKVVETLKSRNELIDYCVIGEPSSRSVIGDVVKNGRRGSLTANLIIQGVQGHVAYPHLAINPIHMALRALDDLTSEIWDKGNQYFPPTTMQIANINAGTGSPNVIPGMLNVQFNFRFSTELTVDGIKQRVNAILNHHRLNFDISWRLSGLPFLTANGELVEAVCASVTEQLGYAPVLETTGGTSDGRFIATMGTQVVELGPLNETIHKIDERVSLIDLAALSKIYQSIMQKILG